MTLLSNKISYNCAIKTHKNSNKKIIHYSNSNKKIINALVFKFIFKLSNTKYMHNIVQLTSISVFKNLVFINKSR